MTNYYPKVLIIGETFHQKSGGGITLSNLFKDWPKDRLANAIDFKHPDLSSEFISVDFFELYNFKKILKFFPVKGIENLQSYNLNNTDKFTTRIKRKIKFLTYKFFRLTSLDLTIYKYDISDDFIAWINKFKPDFIYTQLSSRELIKLTNNIHDITKIPIAVHIMDDWPTTLGQDSILKNYWRNKVHKEFLNLLNKTSIFLSISEAMSIEYLKRYKKKFIPFHNPIDLDFWDIDISKKKKKDKFIILHSGRIGKGIYSSLFESAQIIDDLNKSGLNIELQIQYSYIPTKIQKKLKNHNCVTINPPAPYANLPVIIKSADLLLLCNDFDKKSIDFLKFSMPTKASEYMISKVPILVYSNSKSAVFKHAKKYGWAYSVENSAFLKKAILELMSKQELRSTLSNKAYEYAKTNYDASTVRNNFKSIFIKNYT